MPTISGKYLGGLRVECRHGQSGSQIVTDAPCDNNGKGEAFSPTDLCCASLGSCMMTIMGIYARDHNLDLKGASMEINKYMAANPRKIGKIEIVFTMPDGDFSEADRLGLENAAKTAPMPLTLGANVEQDIKFVWP